MRQLVVLALATAIACTSPGNARSVAGDTSKATTADTGGTAATAKNPASQQMAGPSSDTGVRELQRRADRARIAGDSAAPVWMVEVSDFQCPYCGRFHTESYTRLHNEYIATGRVKLAYVNFPLPMHANAFPAAEASMCAGAQGRFWQMHDALFRTQASWSEQATTVTMFDSLAASAGVKLPAFQQCMRDHVMRGLVQQDMDRGTESGVRSTPTFFVGDTAILGAQPVEVFRRVLDTAIARAARGRGSP